MKNVDALRGTVGTAFFGVPGVLLAVSGGPDSMALLHAAAAWGKSHPAVALRAACVDHGLRVDCATEAEGVRAYAATLGVPCDILPVRPASPAEADARQARYVALVAHAKAHDCAAIATAHHADDAAETLLLYALRGAPPKGMRAKRDFEGLLLLRPFLQLPRATLKAYVERHGIPYYMDPTNDDTDYLRNALRHRVLPALQQVAPGAAARLAQAGRLAADEDEYMEAQSADWFLANVKVNTTVTIPRKAFALLPPALARRVARLAWGRLGLAAPSVDATENVVQYGFGRAGRCFLCHDDVGRPLAARCTRETIILEPREEGHGPTR